MEIFTDQGGGRAVGSRVRMSGQIMGIPLSLEEVVVERDPPSRKAWETLDARLLRSLVHATHGRRRGGAVWRH